MNTLKIILLIIVIVYFLLAMGKPINDWCDKHIFNKKKENLNKTCKEDIELTAKEECFNENMTLGFIAGAEWAYAHPKSITYKIIEDIAKEVINVDWQEQQDKLWKMIEDDLHDKFIDKACKWLDGNFRVSSFDATKIVTHFSNMHDLEDDFRKAMKGE